MIKMLVQVRRRPGMADAAFYDRWQSEHGALVRRHADAMGFIRYDQSHRLPSAEIDAFASGRGWREAPDGQAALWWKSRDAMNAALASADGVAASAELEVDEQAFTDTSRLSAFIAIEETIFDFAGEDTNEAVKMVVEVWKRPDLAAEAFATRWRDAHGELVREHARAMGFTRYVQNHRDRAFPLDFAEARGWLPAPDGIAEVWWANATAMKEALSSPQAAAASAALQADEEQFVDTTRVSAYLAAEHCIFDHVAASA